MVLYDFDNILKTIVLNNRRVIIPDLGAFIQNDDRPLAFSYLLRFNDSFLEEEMKKEGVEGAESMIKSFVEEVKYVVEEGEHFAIGGLGYFYKEGDTIQFNFETTQKPVSPIVPLIHPKPKPTPQTTPKPVSEKKSKTKYWLIALILLLFIVLAGAAYYLWFRPESKNPAEEQLKPLLNKTENSENQFEIKDNTETTGSNSENEEDKTSTPVQPQVGKYHVVVGCFEDKTNASNFVEAHKGMGYANSQIISRIAGLYPVSIGGYNTVGEAYSAQSTYNRKHDEESWIYTIK